jgi:DNA polymerase I-like protein with 3'-5' exonuclease and polymerase domains
VAYIDWEQQEFAVAAALAADKAMMDAYASGDPYLTFAKQAGAVPSNATKASHPTERGQFKVCALAVQYGMAARSLAQSLGVPEARGRDLLRLHQETYPAFWRWSEAAVNHAMLRGWLQTVSGWRVHVGQDANPRSLANFPVQANGAEMLRLACCSATEQGVTMCAPVHDALLIETAAGEIHDAVSATQTTMAAASRTVLAGFELRSEAKIIRWPDRYMDERGARMWDTIMGILAEVDRLRPCVVPAARRYDVAHGCPTTCPTRGTPGPSHNSLLIGMETGNVTPRRRTDT